MTEITIPDTVKQMLMELSIPAKRAGYRFLCVAIPHYAQNSSQRITKELYPYIAEHFGYYSSRGIERSIRSAISDGWNRGDREIWNRYFPDYTRAPTNADFIATLAQYLK